MAGSDVIGGTKGGATASVKFIFIPHGIISAVEPTQIVYFQSQLLVQVFQKHSLLLGGVLTHNIVLC